MIEVTDETFNAEVLESDIPVLVDFWATWCGPCKAIAPYVEKLAEEFDGKVKIVKAEQSVATGSFNNYEIRSIPALLLFKDGQVVETLIGGRPPQIRALLEAAVAETDSE